MAARLMSREESMANRRSVSPVDSRGRKLDKNKNGNGSAPGSPVQSAKGSNRSVKGSKEKASKSGKSSRSKRK